MHARRLYLREEHQPANMTVQVVPGDRRGVCSGTTAGGAKLVAQQLAQHEISLQPARKKAANDAAAFAELNRISTACLPIAATAECFLRVKLGKRAGGGKTAASGLGKTAASNSRVSGWGARAGADVQCRHPARIAGLRQPGQVQPLTPNSVTDDSQDKLV